MYFSIGKANSVLIKQVRKLPLRTNSEGFIVGNSIVLSFFLFFLLLVFKIDDVLPVSWDIVFLVPLCPLIVPTMALVTKKKGG